MNTSSSQSRKNVQSYHLSIGEVLSEAWAKVRGMKKSTWGAIGYIYLVVIGFGILMTLISVLSPKPFVPIITGVLWLIFAIIMLPIRIGLFYLGIRRSVSLPLWASSIFSYFRFLGAFICMYFLQVLIIGTLTFLDLLPSLLFPPGTLSLAPLLAVGIVQVIIGFFIFYVSLSFIFAYFIIVDKHLGVIDAYSMSFSAFTRHWFKIIVTLICALILLIISAIPLLIGLIWTIPMFINVVGILYRTACGVESK